MVDQSGSSLGVVVLSAQTSQLNQDWLQLWFKLVRSKIVSGKPTGQTLEKSNGEMPNDKDVTNTCSGLKILFGLVQCGPYETCCATETFR